MTREEQLDWLYRLRNNISYMDFSIDVEVSLEIKNQYRKVLSEVIEALEQEPCDDWCDVPSDEMTLEQARQAVRDLRKMLAEYLTQDPTTKNCRSCRNFGSHHGICEICKDNKCWTEKESTTKKDVPENNVGNIYICSCGYGWDKSKVVRYHFCPNCGKAVASATKNDLAQERYQDLIEYFGDEKVAKTILESRKEFKVWLERLRWHVKKADELARELEQIKGATKNDLGVDAVSRADARSLICKIDRKHHVSGMSWKAFQDLYKGIDELPSVTPLEPQSFKWCTDCKEYDQEKHCCHRYSKVIRDTVEEMKQEPRKGEWLRMSDLSEQEDDRYKCSRCGNVIHHKNKMDLYTFNSWCGRCGSDNGRHINYEVEV